MKLQLLDKKCLLKRRTLEKLQKILIDNVSITFSTSKHENKNFSIIIKYMSSVSLGYNVSLDPSMAFLRARPIQERTNFLRNSGESEEMRARK